MTSTVRPHDAALADLARDGYVILEGWLDPDRDLAPVLDEYADVVAGIEAGVEAGAPVPPGGAAAGRTITERLHDLLVATGGDCFQQLDISLPLDRDITADTPMHTGPAVFGLLTNPRLLDAVERVIGPEICCNPVQHLRVKPPLRDVPESMREHTLIDQTFWHQDQAVITEESDATDMVSVWLPMFDVGEDDGCLVVVPGSHRSGLTRHCRTPAFNGIPEELLGGPQVPLPMRAGDVLLLHKLTKHASLPNVGDRLRWSFDLRYNPVGQPTGRPWFPEFTARSRRDPGSCLVDPEQWRRSWLLARAELAGAERPDYNRWDPDDPLCA